MKTRDITVDGQRIREYKTGWRDEPQTQVSVDDVRVDMDFNEAVLRASNRERLATNQF